jgi:hypothetical protein
MGISAVNFSIKEIIKGKLFKYIEENKFDIVNYHGARANFTYMFSKNRLKVPAVVTLHSDYRMDFINSRKKRYIFTPLNKVALKSFKYYVCVSNHLKNILMENNFKGTKYVINNGINVNQELILKNDIREKAASWVITLFIMIDSGFVLGELLEQWPKADKFIMAIPELASEYLGLQVFSAWIDGFWTLLIFPLILWTIFGLSLKIAGKSRSISGAWRNFALRAVIIFSAGHLVKSLLKLAESLSYITYAVKDPKGLNNLKAISSGVFSKPDPVLSPVSTIILCLMIISFAIFFAIREQYILKTQSRSHYSGFKKFT